MYGVMTLSQSERSRPGGALATVWRSPQPNRSRSVLSRCSVELGGDRRAVDADRGGVAQIGLGDLAAQASTANGIIA